MISDVTKPEGDIPGNFEWGTLLSKMQKFSQTPKKATGIQLK